MSRRVTKKTIGIMFTLLAVIASLICCVVWYQKNTTPPKLKQAAAKASFPIYSPNTLPEGYALDDLSVSLSSQALVMALKKSGGGTVSITQTPVPQNFDYESFYKSQITGEQEAPSIYGRGKVGLIDDDMSGSLVTDSTWIIIKSTAEMSAQDMKNIVSGLKPIN